MSEQISQRTAREAIDTLRYLVAMFDRGVAMDEITMSQARAALAIWDAERAGALREPEPTATKIERLIANHRRAA